MRALVTGGAGFIGSHIADALVARGHEVVALDNLSTGHRKHVNPRARLVVGDLLDSSLVELLCTERPDVVFHQAAQVNPTGSVSDPLHDARVNVLGTVALLEAARRAGVGKLIYASSAAVYGEPRYVPVDEQHAISPLNPYGASKHTGEHYLEVYAKLHGLRYTILRYANVFGPRQDPFGEGGVVAIFANRMLRGKQPVIHGSGEHERDYVYVSDVAEANLAAAQRGDGGIYNVGCGVGIQTNEIFARLQRLTGYGGEQVHGPPRLGDIFRSVLDPQRAAEDLGWRAQVELEDGLAATVDYFRARR